MDGIKRTGLREEDKWFEARLMTTLSRTLSHYPQVSREREKVTSRWTRDDRNRFQYFFTIKHNVQDLVYSRYEFRMSYSICSRPQ
jgi:hypothetical protein